MCDTEKPKVLGCAAKRRFRIVDLPVPLGPEITIGRGFCCCCGVVEEEEEEETVEDMVLEV